MRSMVVEERTALSEHGIVKGKVTTSARPASDATFFELVTDPPADPVEQSVFRIDRRAIEESV